MKSASTFAIVVIVAFLVIVSQALHTVDQTESALVVQLGKPVKAITAPGLYFKKPFIVEEDR